MLSVAEASSLVEKHLGDTPRATHSRLVAYLMRQLAGIFAADTDLWEIVGLCHDLDFFQTSSEPSRHGLVAVEWLDGSIPMDAQQAIAAHDHRTGVQADTLLADMLKVTDAIAVIDRRLGRRVLCGVDRTDPYADLHSRLGDRPYLSDILWRHADKRGLSFSQVLEFMKEAPPQ